MSVRDVVQAADENTTGSVGSSRYLQKHRRSPIHRIAPFPHDVVQTEIQLIVDQRLLEVFVCLPRGVLIAFGVVHFQRREDGIFVAHIETDQSKDQRLRLVCLEW